MPSVLTNATISAVIETENAIVTVIETTIDDGIDL